MFSHIMIGANDIDASKKFYDAILGSLGHKPGVFDDKGRCFYFADNGIFCLTKPIDGQPATHANGGTIGFAAADSEQADAWHAAGLANGGIACEDPPGIREGAVGKLYLAYLRDPSGNKICAMHRVS
ncbi:VOC family protein [Aestuariirhabdus sp. Z084]|uniref:VOC family protein n=1 Tax=Aestuariirhabdus haliotis TaxID=2918751 RepID=UPI00201B44C2|nr:VOC family protein [Aestuariirhabdus haliotis]MCL6417351.1 VOC family protein [Aestuariirhabdus haliotis]MCL6421296.1 VOC family protein [Aestuariirhabdus haliotis]